MHVPLFGCPPQRSTDPNPTARSGTPAPPNLERDLEHMPKDNKGQEMHICAVVQNTVISEQCVWDQQLATSQAPLPVLLGLLAVTERTAQAEGATLAWKTLGGVWKEINCEHRDSFS